MTQSPSWLKEIEEKPIIRDGTRYYSGKQIDQLLSALKLAIEGLEDIADFDRKIDLEATLNDYRQSTMEAPAELVHMETAREILGKLRQTEGESILSKP